MRIYKDFKEALNEIKRDLAEMGILVHPHTYQDKWVADNPDFDTLELQNYIYVVLNPRPEDLEPTQPWADKEFDERISGIPHNPGKAWAERAEVWKEFLEADGKFSYTYSERMWYQLNKLIREAKDNPDSRQLYLSIWNPKLDIFNIGGWRRVPCSLGYLFQIREEQVNMTYLMRSCDFVTHMVNDIYLATKLLHYFASQVGKPVGRFTHYIGSLHIFQKDVKGVF
jgi:thymidylate synthase